MMGPLVSTTQVGPLTSLLTITSATAWHSGNYTCVAGNRAGSTNYSVSLLVHGTCLLAFNQNKHAYCHFMILLFLLSFASLFQLWCICGFSTIFCTRKVLILLPALKCSSMTNLLIGFPLMLILHISNLVLSSRNKIQNKHTLKVSSKLYVISQNPLCFESCLYSILAVKLSAAFYVYHV